MIFRSRIETIVGRRVCSIEIRGKESISRPDLEGSIKRRKEGDCWIGCVNIIDYKLNDK